MIKKIIIFILHFYFIKSLNLKKTLSSIFISSSLFNSNSNLYPNPNQNQNSLLPQITKLEKIEQIEQIKSDKLEKLEINKISNDKNLEPSSNIKVQNNNIYFYGAVTSESCKELSDILVLLDTNAKIFSLNLDRKSVV